MVLYTKFHSRNQLSIISLSARERELRGELELDGVIFGFSGERRDFYLFFKILRLKQ